MNVKRVYSAVLYFIKICIFYNASMTQLSYNFFVGKYILSAETVFSLAEVVLAHFILTITEPQFIDSS